MHNVFLQTPDIFLGGAPLHLKHWGSTVNLKKKKGCASIFPSSLSTPRILLPTQIPILLLVSL